jgi:hypothetical protein
VGEQVGVRAAGVFEGVGQDRQVVEGAVVVDVPGDRGDGAVVPLQPRGFGGDRAERVAEDVADEISLSSEFRPEVLYIPEVERLCCSYERDCGVFPGGSKSRCYGRTVRLGPCMSQFLGTIDQFCLRSRHNHLSLSIRQS